MKRVRGVTCLFLVVIFVACFSAIAVSQAVNATLLGTVTDKSGAYVADAKVSITEITTNIRRVTNTNASGNYEFPNLPPGQYRVDIEQSGFKKATTPSVSVPINSAVRVDAALEPGQAQETVTVTAEAALLQTDRADVGAKLESKQVTDLPLANNHNFQNLLNLVPGTVRAHREHSEFFNSQDTVSTEVNGQSRLFNNLQIEGVDDNERTGLLQVYVPPAEAIQTVDVTTSNYAAEFGRAGGAVTNVQLKSGTNDYHGSAYEFNRVSALAARTYFNRKQNNSPFPRTTYNYYGGTFGGPIIKNKTFFFADILRIDDLRGRFNLLTVPQDAYRNGDFSAAGINIYDPFTGSPDGSGRQQFSCNGRLNVICPDRFSPISQKLLALIPHANLPGTISNNQISNNFQNTTRFLKHNTAFDVKIDHQMTDNDRFAFRFSRAVQNITEDPVFGVTAGGPGGPNKDAFQGTGIQHQQGGALNHTHAFSGTFLVETRVGINNYRNVAHNADFGKKDGDAFGIPGANLDDFTSGIPSIVIAGYSNNPIVGYSASLPWDRGETVIDIVNNWTKLRGNHTFKWGADVRRLRDDLVQAQTFSPRGLFRFGQDAAVAGTTQRSGDTKTNQQANDFAAFLIDMPNNGTGVAVGRDISVISGSWRETQTFFFGQDSWKITPKFTLDAGLRWEIYFPATPSRSGRYSNYDPFTNTLVVAGVGNNPKNLGRQTYFNNFAPRLGLAYRLKETTVVRAGFGVSYEPFPNNNYAFQFPVRQNNGFSASLPLAAATLPNGQIARMVNGFPAPAPVVIPSNGIVSPNPPGDYFVVDKHFQQPYVEAWNLAVQQALPSNWVLDMAYVGNVGRRIPMQIDLNAAQAPAVDATGKVISNCFVRPGCAAFGRTNATNFLFKRSTSNYNALQVKLDHKWAHGFLLTTSYTWAKSLAYRSDMGSDGGNAVYQVTSGPFANFRRNYMNTSRDRHHTFVQSYIYELPFGKGKPWLQQGIGNWLLGGWQLSGILTIMSGTPLDFNANGNTLATAGTRQTPIQIAPFRVLGGIDSTNWFDTSAFCQIGTTGCPVSANGVLSPLARYSYRGPKFVNLDAGVFRRFTITERTGLEVRAQAFGVTNTPQFDNPNADFTSANFGKIKGAQGSRTVELGAKFTF